MTGFIATVRDDRGYGFIRGEGRDYFFHASDLRGVEFSRQMQNMRVTFEPEESDKGWRAKQVQPAN